MGVIEVRDLVKVYTRGDVRAVDSISLTVDEGEVFAFLGPNGAGKTTCVKMMTTLVTPTSGTVHVAGHDAVADPIAVRNSIGVALQDVGLDPLSTGREMLIMQSRLYAVADPRGRAEELLQVVGLTEAADRRLGSYSGGMKRRLDLAAALVHRPRVLFLDEPTTGLDPASRQSVWAEVRRLNERGTTIFLTTQYLEEADSLADRVAIIDHGRIVAEGTPGELKSTISEDVVRVRVPDDQRVTARRLLEQSEGVVRIEGDRTLDAFVRNGAAAVPAIVRAFDREGLELLEISLHRPTLDDVFLQATGSRLEGSGVVTTEVAQ
jgi:ABC-2 type transport system ATP-binding protein